MNELLQEARTVAVKACTHCDSGLLERDKFCRWCGARQPGLESSGTIQVQDLPAGGGACSAPQCATVAIAAGARTDVYRRISGPLVNAVVSGALSVPSTENQSAFIKRVILALISIPIWLIIILLSPLDAYAAVKNLARQV
jgi:hypothetical protein